ncbi:MAG: PAS domain S-box protein [Chthoniobacterales bacterium]|nr:PAS domain S-box protein [Chthoniobacterales bacterium]
MNTNAEVSSRDAVLIVAPIGKDAALAAGALEQADIPAQICDRLSDCSAQIGESTLAILIAQEALAADELPLLPSALQAQPPWSDIPVIILTSTGGGDRMSLEVVNIFGPAGNVTLLERPLRSVTLVSAVRVALRARYKQREVQKLLAQRETVLTGISDSFAALDHDWRYTYVNYKAAEYAGLAREQMIGRRIWDVYPEAKGGTFYRYAHRAVKTQQPQQFEQYYDRWKCWLETRIYPAVDGVAVFRANISERKIAEEALHEKEALVRLLLDSAADGFYGVDRKGVTTHCNTAFLRMLGFEREEEVIGKKLHDVIHHTHADGSPYPKIECHIYQTAQTGKPAHIDDELFFRKDGSSFPVEYWAYPINRDGELRGAVTTFIDITERRQAQLALQKAKQEAEEANRAKDQFLAMLSHELRTPLTPVLMTIASLRRQPDISDELRRDLEVLQRNVELEALLIDDLLDLTRITHGKLELRLDAVDVHVELEHALNISDADLAAKTLSVMRRFEAREHHCWADAARLQQVFWNLVKNAVKFTAPGGEVVVHTRNDPAHSIVVEITDTGIGIAPELLPRIFDAFEQGGRTITSQYGGLGLGLAISKRVIDLHGGTIAAYSEGTGRGARFAVTLRAMETSLLEGPAIYLPPSTRAAASAKILLVEDHEDTARVLRRILQHAGHTVSHAATIHAALALAKERGFNLVISDLGLPDGSGLDLMRTLHAEHALPGIALSGFGTEDDLAASSAAGFTEHLTKPVDWPQLRNAIQRLLSNPTEVARV